MPRSGRAARAQQSAARCAVLPWLCRFRLRAALWFAGHGCVKVCARRPAETPCRGAVAALARDELGGDTTMIPNDFPALNFDLGETADQLRASVRGFTADEIAPL